MGFNQEFAASLSRTNVKDKKEQVQRLDYNDLAILRWLVDFQASGKMTTIDTEDGRYFYVSYSKLLEDMPLLSMTKQAVKNRLQKMVALGLLKYHLAFQSQTFYRMGDDFIKLIHKDGGGNTQVTGGCELSIKGVVTQVTGGCELSHNNSLIKIDSLDKEIKNNSLSKDERAIDSTLDSLKSRINAMYHRRESTAWSVKEMTQLKIISKRPEVLEELSDIEKWHETPNGKQFGRHDVITFLNNFSTEVDRARAFLANPNPTGTQRLGTDGKPLNAYNDPRDPLAFARGHFSHDYPPPTTEMNF